MTTAADTVAEKAFEAALAGRAVPGEAAGLAAFTETVRASAAQPGRPNAALAELLSTGLLVDQPSPSARTAKRRRRRMWFLSALFAKIVSAGAVAQAATGAGIVFVGLTTAGATGNLPAPVQHTFDSVVQTVTGSDATTSTDPATPSDTPAVTSTEPADVTPSQPAETSDAGEQQTSTEGTSVDGGEGSHHGGHGDH